MPFNKLTDLPQTIQQGLPEAAQQTFMDAYNAFMGDELDGDERRAYRCGWAAVKHAFAQDKDGKWLKREAGQQGNQGNQGVDGVARVEFEETVALDAANAGIRMTNDGYMVAMPRVARTGIQDYAGWEVGRPDMKRVRVYRPPEEVFKADSAASFAYKPITDDHPPEQVTADNWKKYARGQAGGEIGKDGIFMRVPMVFMDSAVIKKVNDGKVELSVGYSTDLKWVSGMTPDNEAYDAMQTNIRANHIALVDKARGGSKLRVGDKHKENELRDDETAGFDFGRQCRLVDTLISSSKGDTAMADVTLKKMTIDSVEVDMTDTAISVTKRALDQRDASIKELTQKLADAQAEVVKVTTQAATDKAANETAVKAKDAEITTLKQQVTDAALTPAKLDDMVKARSTMIDKAKVLMGDTALVIDGKSDHEIRKQVVDAKVGEAAKAWDEAQVRVSFDSLAAGVQAPGVTDTAHAFSGGGQPGYQAPTLRKQDASYDKYDTDISKRWQNPGNHQAPAARQ